MAKVSKKLRFAVVYLNNYWHFYYCNEKIYV